MFKWQKAKHVTLKFFTTKLIPIMKYDKIRISAFELMMFWSEEVLNIDYSFDIANEIKSLLVYILCMKLYKHIEYK